MDLASSLLLGTTGVPSRVCGVSELDKILSKTTSYPEIAGLHDLLRTRNRRKVYGLGCSVCEHLCADMRILPECLGLVLGDFLGQPMASFILL